MKALLYCLLAISCPVSTTHAQSSINKIEPLHVGDTLPDVVFPETYYHNTTTICLSDFPQKLIILDYWATWCGSCLKMLPLIDSLQQEYANEIQIILIGRKGNGDDITKIETVLNRLKLSPFKSSIPIVVGDTFALQHYEMMFLPHYIWIDRERVIRAITDSEQLTRRNIEAVVKGYPLSIPIKED